MAAPAPVAQPYYDDDDSLEGSDAEGYGPAPVPFAAGGVGQQYAYDDEDDEYDQEYQAQLAQQREAQAAQQAAEAEEALASVHQDVKKFIFTFYQHFHAGNAAEIGAMLDQGWGRLTERFFKDNEWPRAEVIAPLVNNDEIFLTFYKELYFRHVYAKLNPDIEDRFLSYENYCAIFNYILNSEGPVPLNLPTSWLYDIIDEFIWQFSSFATWRSQVDRRVEAGDVPELVSSPQVWSCYSVLNVLYSLIQKSRIQEQLRAVKKGEDVDEAGGEYGSKPLYRMLGYFSIIGLLRVHVLLGDYTLALKIMDDIELSRKAWFVRVPTAFVTVYYYVGFSYLMLKRYADAAHAFSTALSTVHRFRYHGRASGGYDPVTKTSHQMYALLAVCVSLWPTKGDTLKVDDTVLGNIRERVGHDLWAALQKGGLAAVPVYTEIFLRNSPRYISANSPPYDDPARLALYKSSPTGNDLNAHHLSLFLASIEPILRTADLKPSMKLYTTVGTEKLARLLSTKEDKLVQDLMVVKGATEGYAWSAGGLLEGEEVRATDLEFGIDLSNISVQETRPQRRYGEYISRRATKSVSRYEEIRSKELPIAPPKPGQASAQGQRPPQGQPQVAGAAATGAKKVGWGQPAPAAGAVKV